MTTTPPVSAQDQFSGTKPVEERHRIDEVALARWLEANVEGYEGPLEVRQFKGGQSNPTYQLVTPRHSYVLRRKPPGKLLPSAHAVDREFRVISALNKVNYPVAKAYALCTDDSVIGTMFYVMDNVEGRILWDLALPGCTPQQRTDIYNAKVTTLAALHNVDYKAVGLEDFGKPGNYFSRQIDRWSKQYRASETETIPAMDRLMEWLPRTVPEDDLTTIVHGDYRLDNMILHPTDFTYFMMQWVMPGTERSGLADLDLKALGIPSLEDMVALYCRETGRTGLPTADWYFAYNLFRLGAICQGIVGRVRDGTANSPQATAMAARVAPLGENAWKFAVKAGA